MKRAAFALALILAGPASAANDAYRRGIAALAAGTPRVARVEFLNAIQASPDDPRPHVGQARTFLMLGDGFAADAELARAAALGTPAADTRHLRAEALLLQGKPDAALVAATGTSRFSGAALRMRGRAHQALGRVADAAFAYSGALRISPGDADLWFDVAGFRLATGERAGAIEAADRALAANRRHVPALVLRGLLVGTQYGPKAALPWFARAQGVDPEHVPAWTEEAAALGELGRTREMLAATRTALALRADDGQARYLQAALAARARNFPLARALYARVSGPVLSRPAALLLGGVIDLEVGNTAQAIGRLGALIEAQPGNMPARRLLGLAHLRAGDPRSALAVLRSVEGEAVADSYALTLLAAAYAGAGERGAAARALVRAAAPSGGSGLLPVDLGGTLDTPAFVRAAQIRWELGYGSAWSGVAAARALAAENPGAPEADLVVGDALIVGGGSSAEAAAAYRDASNVAFNEPAALRLVEALQAAGRPDQARVALALFLDQNPRSLPASRLLANLRVAASDWPAAAAAYDRVRARTGDHDAVLLNNLAWARFEEGDAARALGHATRAHALAPGNIATADARGWMLLKTGGDRSTALTLLRQAWLAK